MLLICVIDRYYSSVEVQQVRSFVEVARHRSFSKAASKLGRTQPTITASVQGLERELRVLLFERSSHGVTLTPAGSLFLESVGPLLQTWETVPTALQEALDGVARGPVRVGAGEAAVLYLLPDPIRRFLKRNRQVELIIRHQAEAETLAMLRRGELDFGIRSLSSVPREMTYLRFLTCDRVLICPRGHPARSMRALTLENLSRYRFVMPWKESETRTLIERALESRGLPCNIALEAGGWEIIKRYVALGLGIAVIPEFCLGASDRRPLAPRSVRHLFGQDTYGLVLKSDRPLTAAAKSLASEFRADLGTSRVRQVET